MKKFLVIILTAVLALSMVGCGSKKEEGQASGAAVKDSLEILTTAWTNFDEANRFPISGGGYNNMTMDVPGVLDAADTDSLTALLSFPVDSVGMIDDAASMMHAMNANTFTAAAYHLTDAANQQALADALKDSIMNTQWLCGFPEVMLIASVGNDYVVTCIGNTALVEEFKAQITAAYGDGTAVLYEESLM